jgi:hypothetical protein
MFEILISSLLIFVLARPYYLALSEGTDYAAVIIRGEDGSALNEIWRKYEGIESAQFLSIIGLVCLEWALVYTLPELYPFSTCADDPFSLVCQPYWLIHFELRGFFIKWMAILIPLVLAIAIVRRGYKTLGEKLFGILDVVSAGAHRSDQVVLFLEPPRGGFIVRSRDSFPYEPAYRVQMLAEDHFAFDVSPPNTSKKVVNIVAYHKKNWPRMRDLYNEERSS